MKKILLILTALLALFPAKVKADELIIHKCEATGYCINGLTADGTVIDSTDTNVVASKKEWIGSTMIIFFDDGDGIIKAENYLGTYEIKDTGSEAIKSGRVVDIHMSDYETAINFGRKKVIVQIIKSKG